MLKIFTTQLVGHFNNIQEDEELNIEDSSRALAQAIVSDGTVYVHGFEAAIVVANEAVLGEERLPSTSYFITNGEEATLTSIDRIIVAAPSATHIEAINFVKRVKESGALVIGLSPSDGEGELFKDVCDFHIDTKLINPLVPQDDGTRIGLPKTITALYAYYALYLTTKEILLDYDM